jgi:hypothetical protein
MKLDWIALTNYAEDRGGLLYIAGGGFDTINVQSPIEGAPSGVFAIMQGTLVVRVLLQREELGNPHRFSFEIVDEDGQQIAKADGDFRAEHSPGLPLGWDQASNLIFPLTGLGLPKPGNYTINLFVDDELLGDRPFRVLKLY